MPLLPESGKTTYTLPSQGTSTGQMAEMYQQNKKLNRVIDLAADFGAVLDGVTDTLAKWNSALAVGLPILLTGPTFCSARLTLPAGAVILGIPGVSSIEFADSDEGGIIHTIEAGVVLRDLIIDGGVGSGDVRSLIFDGATDFLVERCRFRNMKSAIWLNDDVGPPADGSITGCWFEEVVDQAVWVSGESDRITIDRNTIEDVTAGVSDGPAAIRYNGRTGEITRNRILGSVDTGIMLTTTECFDTIVEGNQIVSTLVSIFAGSGAQRFQIRGNNVSSANDFGMHFKDADAFASDAVVIGNHIHDCGKSGMVVEGMQGLAIHGNVVQRVGLDSAVGVNQRSGIVVTNQVGSGDPSENISITGNIVNDRYGTGTMEVGILLESVSPNISMSGNSVQDATTANYGYTGPSIATESDAGSGASASVTGTDTAGHINLNTGTGANAGNLVRVTYSVPYTDAPIGVLITPANPSAIIGALYTSGDEGGFYVVGDPPDSTNLQWNFLVLTADTIHN